MRHSVGRWLRGVLLSLAMMPAAACSSPTLQGFDPPQGPPRSLVTVQGAHLELSSVIWDFGQPGERTIPGSLSGPMFSVPANATPGTHPVAIENFGGVTRPMNFVVNNEPALRLDYPRLEHVMTLFAQFDSGRMNALLYVQGANFDVGAVVEMDGAPVATIAHKGLMNDLYQVPPDELGYPIDHYLSVVAVPGPMAPGDHMLVVRNLDNVTSRQPFKYTVPSSLAGFDSDGDSLPDSWELAGHDGNGDGVNDVDQYRPDILVELDIMNGLDHPLASTAGAAPGALDTVRAMFGAAPFLNPFSANGINLMLDASGTVPEWDTVIFDRTAGNPGDGVTTVAFSKLKAENFTHAAYGDMYHYIIWAKRQLGGSSGESDYPWELQPGQPGDDAIIGLDNFEASYQSPRSQAEILAHELGHNLGQRHGGPTDEPYNPNYWSVMSYTWALRTGATVVERRKWVTCLPFYYGKAGETEPLLQVPSVVNMIVDYSAGMASQIVENNGSLDEKKGVCNQAVDWDEDGRPGEPKPMSGNGNGDANDNDIFSDTIDDAANWPALKFNGPSSNGTIP
jgi:hypothetical protein